jgi:phosphonate transport system substrate-binding protein
MSTHGYLVPRKMLERAGVPLEDLGSYRYTGSFMNVAMDVLNGECDAGSIQDTLANRLASEGKIKIIQASEPYPSSVIAYNSSVDSTIVQSVKDALLAFDPTGRQKDSLFDWDMTGMPLGFSEINDLELNKVMSLAREYGLFVSENAAGTDGKGQ